MPTVAEVMALASRHQEAGNLQEAERLCGLVLQVAPHHAEAIHILGLIAYQQGRGDQAIAYLEQALALWPNMPFLHANLGLAYHAVGNLDAAIAHQQQALRLDPAFAGAHYNLGGIFRQQDKQDEALACFAEAMRLAPTWAPALQMVAIVLIDMGRLEEALALFYRGVELQPNSSRAHSDLCYALHFRFAEDRELLAREHERWYMRHALPLEMLSPPHYNDPDPDRRLRVGYVSPNFARHAVGRFLLPLLECHDHDLFEIFCYSSGGVADELTQQLRGHADHWRDVGPLSDEQLAERIREDRIDLLVDLTAHMAGSRLLVFARKPAPVQLTYLAYCSTTGLRTIDYRLSDPFLDPPEGETAFYAEKTVRLPETYWCYRPDSELPPPGQLPVLATSQLTFGCLNTFWKLTPPTLAAWRELVRGLPGSRLLLHARGGSHRDQVRQFFAQGAVDPARITFVGYLSMTEYLSLYDQIDVGLDPFPYCGGTTTCDALWMGVPVISLAGRAPVSRAGLGILTNVGLPELVAGTSEAYVRLAAELAGDLPRLTVLRAGLRERMLKSALMDAPRFTRNIEAAFRCMWQRWCRKRAASPIDRPG